ncbi:MAG: hypothetical protein ACKVG9_01425 [Rhodospirillales bacterium]
MSNPRVTNITTYIDWGFTIPFTSATTNRNILSNKASSGLRIELIYLRADNHDGTSGSSLQMKRYNQDGTAMNSNSGIRELAYGSDGVAGASLGDVVPLNLVIPTVSWVTIFDVDKRLVLHEDESLVAQVANANRITLNGVYRVYRTVGV